MRLIQHPESLCTYKRHNGQEKEETMMFGSLKTMLKCFGGISESYELVKDMETDVLKRGNMNRRMIFLTRLLTSLVGI
jgi:hypothetical protein